jgi:hypothetical protein
MYKNSVLTSQKTYYVFALKMKRLILFNEKIVVYCESHMKERCTLWVESTVYVKTGGNI